MLKEDCGSTGMPGNWGGGTSADAMSFRMLADRVSKRRKKIKKIMEEFSKRVKDALKAANERDKQDDAGYEKRVKELKAKNLNKKEDINMAVSKAAETYNRIILSEDEAMRRGRGRPPKDPVAHAAKMAARAKLMGTPAHEVEDEADKNIVMQMKKAAGAAEVHAHLAKPSIENPVKPQFHEVEYANGQKQRVSPRIANKWLEKHASLKPEGKLQMQLHSQKSHAHLMQAIGEEILQESSHCDCESTACKADHADLEESCKLPPNGKKLEMMGHKYKVCDECFPHHIKAGAKVIKEDIEESANIPSTQLGVKCKSCGEGHKVSGKVMMDGYHAACKDVSKKAADYVAKKEDVQEAFGSKKAVHDRNNNQFKDLNFYPKAKLIFSKDAEPSCPSCGNHNAMLHKHDAQKQNLFKCRDCGHTVEHVGEALEEGRIADKLKEKGDKKDPKKKGVMKDYFKNKYKKRHGEIEKNED